MLEDKVIKDIQVTDTTKISIALRSYNGHQYIDIRTFYLPEVGDTYLPTKKGITLSLDDEIPEQFLEGVKELIDYVDGKGTVDAGGESNDSEGSCGSTED